MIFFWSYIINHKTGNERDGNEFSYSKLDNPGLGVFDQGYSYNDSKKDDECHEYDFSSYPIIKLKPTGL